MISDFVKTAIVRFHIVLGILQLGQY
ncbi:hypothetical protein CY0110_17422 [Crocosphaera chwakensis CCY0110]|uniref:Uncharacterized protein n=1 Tax=Crocosphaera chwakensis CCY0110 TaxID=391612 RepID=A3IIG6_9CHRO|nr:hypothetical protein CY0110_17422 [Crocosphaera chwakensis CCY0110]